MQWSDLPRNPSIRTLRQFAGLWIVFFGGSGGWRWLVHDEASRGIVFALVASIGLLGLVKPSVMRPIFVGWMVVTFPIGWVVSRLMLIVVFYGVFTPIGLLFRVMGRDLLQLKRRSERTSYWASKPSASAGRSYYRQF